VCIHLRFAFQSCAIGLPAFGAEIP
jgi:hypothetical protein